MKKFDLNIDRMLENWDAFHAVREIIANALDEQALTGTQEISIARDGDGFGTSAAACATSTSR